jgi:hypothetical protein
VFSSNLRWPEHLSDYVDPVDAIARLDHPVFTAGVYCHRTVEPGDVGEACVNLTKDAQSR